MRPLVPQYSYVDYPIQRFWASQFISAVEINRIMQFPGGLKQGLQDELVYRASKDLKQKINDDNLVIGPAKIKEGWRDDILGQAFYIEFEACKGVPFEHIERVAAELIHRTKSKDYAKFVRIIQYPSNYPDGPYGVGFYDELEVY